MSLLELIVEEKGHDGKADPHRKMSEEEFEAWSDEKTRAEWVDGEVIMMAPVSGEHDDLQGWLRSLLGVYVSPDSTARDWREKYLDYQRAGVREYWIVDRRSSNVHAYAIGNDAKYARIIENEGRIISGVIRGLYIRPEWLFEEKLPNVLGVLKELGVSA